VLACTFLTGCAGHHTNPAPTAPVTLKDAFKGLFLIGAAVNPDQFTERDARGAALVKTQFNAITPENVLKWQLVHPQPDRYNFEPSDRYVAFGETNGMAIIGHTLVWHNQTPAWVFRNEKGDALDREALLARMRDHIHTVVGRYKGRIRGWDVVNEAVDDGGSMRQSSWMKIIGEDYAAKAYEFAHEADPGAELYYNDFDLEKPAKRKGALALIKRLQASGAPITGVGLQHHDHLQTPTVADVETTIEEFAALGLKVMITELDVDVLPRGSMSGVRGAAPPRLNPYTNGLPDSVQQEFTRRYAELFAAFVKHHDKIGRVTFWGVTDADSWLNNYPIPRRTNYPLLFDRNGDPKPAFDAVLRTAPHPPAP
jgi:endo-1,4-beta-xylanase